MSRRPAHFRDATDILRSVPANPGLPNPGDVIGGKYALTRVIGAGGMGVVYEAMHLRLRQRVAIKMLQPELAARGDFVARFDREARAAVKLRSPHVARVLDVDALDDGTPYLVMEFLEGRDLSAEIAARGRLPVAEAVDYVLQTCDAMGEAHRQGTVHRDLKPSNLFLASDERGRVVKVLDFGISKVVEEGSAPSVTSTFSVLGTALYMSPEQVRSAKHVDARSDVWALGVILYELLAGRSPFVAPSATAVAAAVVADAPVPLGMYRPDVPGELEAAVMLALEKDRDRRFSDATALAAAIAPFGPARAALSSSLAHAGRTHESLDRRSDGPALLSPAPTVTAAEWTPGAPRASPARRRVIAGSLAVVAGAVTIAVLALEPRGPTSPEPVPLGVEPRASSTQPAAASHRPIAAQQEQSPPPEASSTSAASSAALPAPSANSKPLPPPPEPSAAPKAPAPIDPRRKTRPAVPAVKKGTADLPEDPG